MQWSYMKVWNSWELHQNTEKWNTYSIHGLFDLQYSRLLYHKLYFLLWRSNRNSFTLIWLCIEYSGSKGNLISGIGCRAVEMLPPFLTTLRRKQVELLKTVIFTSRMLLLDRARPNRWGYRHNQVQTEFCTELWWRLGLPPWIGDTHIHQTHWKWTIDCLWYWNVDLRAQELKAQISTSRNRNVTSQIGSWRHYCANKYLPITASFSRPTYHKSSNKISSPKSVFTPATTITKQILASQQNYYDITIDNLGFTHMQRIKVWFTWSLFVVHVAGRHGSSLQIVLTVLISVLSGLHTTLLKLLYILTLMPRIILQWTYWVCTPHVKRVTVQLMLLVPSWWPVTRGCQRSHKWTITVLELKCRHGILHEAIGISLILLFAQNINLNIRVCKNLSWYLQLHNTNGTLDFMSPLDI